MAAERIDSWNLMTRKEKIVALVEEIHHSLKSGDKKPNFAREELLFLHGLLTGQPEIQNDKNAYI
jgi:hypothetical protein